MVVSVSRSCNWCFGQTIVACACLWNGVHWSFDHCNNLELLVANDLECVGVGVDCAELERTG